MTSGKCYGIKKNTNKKKKKNKNEVKHLKIWNNESLKYGP